MRYTCVKAYEHEQDWEMHSTGNRGGKEIVFFRMEQIKPLGVITELLKTLAQQGMREIKCGYSSPLK